MRITKENIEEWLKIHKENYMSKKLPKCYMLQGFINEMFGLDKDCYHGNGISTMNLDRKNLLRLTLEILKLKDAPLRKNE